MTIEFTTSQNLVTLRAEREIAYDGQTARAHYIANTDWTAEALLDDDGDMTINAYDWTPRGEASDFDLRVVGGVTMDGSENRPYPVYNIWQLQAIDGVVPAEATAALSSDVASASHAAGQTLYGADPTARLAASYRLEFDIDATPTRDWNSGSGFDPIGGSFSGVFDGGGMSCAACESIAPIPLSAVCRD